MPRRCEAKALVGTFKGQVGRIEALGAKNVQIGEADVLISFGDHKPGVHAPIHAVPYNPGEWERLTPPRKVPKK